MTRRNEAFALVTLAKAEAKSLGRIAGAYEAHKLGDADAARVIEVVRQELEQVDKAIRRAQELVAVAA